MCYSSIGKDFGVRPQVLLSDGASTVTCLNAVDNDTMPYACLAVTEEPHSAVSFEVPVWQGKNLIVSIAAGGQVSNSTLRLSYKPPVASIEGALLEQVHPTEGSSTIEINGKGFGLRNESKNGNVYGRVFIGNKEADCSEWSDTRVVCHIPEGEGEDLDVVVQAGNQRTVLSERFSYSPPVLMPGHFVFNTSSWQGQRLILQGSNLGTYGEIVLGGRVFRSDDPLVYVYNHSTIVMQVPEGQGKNLPLHVVVGGQRSKDEVVISYFPPEVYRMDLTHFPTDTCYSWKRLEVTNRGVFPGPVSLPGFVALGIVPEGGIPARPCCQPTLLTVKGNNFGGAEARIVVEFGDSRVWLSCKDLLEEYETNYSGPKTKLMDGTLCPERCEDSEFRRLHFRQWEKECNSGKCCRRGNVFDDPCPCPMLGTGCIVSHSHDELTLRPPPGFGETSTSLLW